VLPVIPAAAASDLWRDAYPPMPPLCERARLRLEFICPQRQIAVSNGQSERDRMSAAKGSPQRGHNAAKRSGLWRGFAERFYALVAYPARHAVSERDLRRVDDDIRRCRQLLLAAPAPVHAAAGSGGRAVFRLGRAVRDASGL